MKDKGPDSYHALLPGGAHSESLIFRCIVGSQAYGTATPESDTDYRGIYVLPSAAYLSLHSPPEQLADEKNDQTYYALRRFIELAAGANPNILELMFMPDDCIVHRTRCSDKLIESRQLFITRRAYESHVAYAVSQVKRARGQNKWVHNPKPETPPRKEDFCWFIPLQPAQNPMTQPTMPLRPVSLGESGIRLEEFHAAALEHTRDLYRLYHYGGDAKGVFRGENLVCESIPMEDENTRFFGLLIYNQPAYDAAVRDHRNYWDWHARRNQQRWITQERGEVDYDPKNMMHTLRLMLSARHVFTEGSPLVRFSGDNLRLLKQVRAGEFTYDELMKRVDEEAASLMKFRDKSSLPEAPDENAVAQLLQQITAMWEHDHV